jgi:hypothetical protein
VNFTADSGIDGGDGVGVIAGGSTGAGDGTASNGRSGDTDGSLVIVPSLPFRQPIETTAVLTVR